MSRSKADRSRSPARLRQTPTRKKSSVVMVPETDASASSATKKWPVVTPDTRKTGKTTDTFLLSEQDPTRRTLFRNKRKRSPISEEEQKKVEPKAKRKLIFGRMTDQLIVQENVRQVYKVIKKLSGSIGGNASGGPIYGELTMGSMQKIVNLMKEQSGFSKESRFIDVGSGIGKPNLHVTQDPGVEFSYGIEVDEDRWLLGLNCLKGVLDLSKRQGNNYQEEIKHRCIFVHDDIMNAKAFDPFTHVYMFSIGFPPKLWIHLADMWNRSLSPYLLCYSGPKNIIDCYEFDVELVTQTSTSMHGSKEGHMAYLYRRPKGSETIESESRQPKCDELFVEPWKLVNLGLDKLKEEVDAQLDKKMVSGTSTRASRRRLKT